MLRHIYISLSPGSIGLICCSNNERLAITTDFRIICSDLNRNAVLKKKRKDVDR